MIRRVILAHLFALLLFAALMAYQGYKETQAQFYGMFTTTPTEDRLYERTVP